MELTVNDFFCGAGGVGLGFQQAGFKIIWACDFDKYAVQTYRHNVGNYVIQADIKKLSRADIPTADVWHLPKEERAKIRSQTFPGIARAIAEQWTPDLTRGGASSEIG